MLELCQRIPVKIQSELDFLISLSRFSHGRTED